MEAKTVSVKGLLGMHFNIPYYQRGYRWEDKQVKDLLNDLQEFYYKTQDTSQDASFYCMQPLVVVKNEQLSRKTGQTVYDLIDGQQRLTTIFLLLSYFKSNERSEEDSVGQLFTLSYERLDDNISLSLFKVENLQSLTDESRSLLCKYNDFFFLFRAYQTIKKWFKSGQGHINWMTMLPILLGNGTNSLNQHDVRFLWYEPDQEIRNEEESNILRGSIDIFNRLNYGQTPLTSTDLIKAMVMICDIYPMNDRQLRNEESSRYASEWDLMEKRLHNRLLWSMLVANDYQPSSRMELLFDYVAHGIYETNIDNEEWKEAFKDIKVEEKDFSYRVVSTYLQHHEGGIVPPGTYKTRVAEVWDQVQKTYHMFCNWFNNRKTYHLIGLYILLHDKLLGGETKSRYELLKELVDSYSVISRECFIEELKMKIGDKIRIKSTYKDDSKEEHHFTLENINYNETPKDIIRILTLFNVDQTMNEVAENPLFDFELFKRTNPTSLEHIHPQNLKINDKELTDWYNRRKVILQENNKIPDTSTNDPKELSLLNAIKVLDVLLYKSTKTDDEKRTCDNQLEIIDRHFDELAHIDSSEMHTIKNMALVDGPVNSAFSNKLLNEKREIMYEKAAELNKDLLPEHYIMICTRKAFNKAFTPKEQVIDLKFWGKNDRDAYFQQISEVYNNYVK